VVGEMNELIVGKTRIALLQGDITQQATDAIINAANSSLMGGGGVDGAIHLAGGPSILEECKKIISRIGKLEPGNAVITSAGNLKAKYIIHTVGPIWHGGRYGESEILASAYRESLKLAIAYKIETISFPSISTGAYRYPVDEAASLAIKTVIDFIHENNTPLHEIYFVLYDAVTYRAYSTALTESANNI
jgi:O-acetyl-ADP-ribose deacetylase (regulator of RNase III)